MTEGESKFDFIVLVLLVATVTAFVSLSVYLLVYRKPSIAAGSLLVNVGFSGFLVYLYLRMVRTQERQQEIMKAHHKPLMEIGPVDVEAGEIHVSLLNSGNGPLEAINLVSELGLSGDCDYHGKTVKVPMSKRIKQGPEGSKIPPLKMENSLKPNEGKRHFTGFPKFSVVSPNDGVVKENIEDCFEKIFEDCDSINIEYTIYIEGQDLFGDSIRESIIGGQFSDLDTPLPFGEVYALSGAHVRK